MYQIYGPFPSLCPLPLVRLTGITLCTGVVHEHQIFFPAHTQNRDHEQVLTEFDKH